MNFGSHLSANRLIGMLPEEYNNKAFLKVKNSKFAELILNLGIFVDSPFLI